MPAPSRAWSSKRTVTAPLTPALSSLLGPQQGECQARGGGLSGWENVFLLCWQVIFFGADASLSTWQPPPGFSSLHWNHRQSQSNNPKKTTQTLRYSPNPPGRSKATRWCHQLACVNAKHATFWAMLAVGKSHPPQQVHRGLRRCLYLVHDLWPIRKSGPGPKNTFKLVSPYLS